MKGEGIRWRAVYAVWWRNFHFYRRSWYLNILPNFFEPVFYLVALGLGLGWYVREIHGMPYAQYLAPALIIMATINGASFEATWNIFVRMNRERRYDAILTTPINEHEIICGELGWAVTRAMLYGVAFLLVTAVLGLISSPYALMILLLIPIVGYLFAALGMAYALGIPAIDFF
ncbi:MAG: ABC transporter permease, partial [Deltaproteobacteria bacterium]|nr:ABC transporter permease [Deltaproteobacteria bacterium]